MTDAGSEAGAGAAVGAGAAGAGVTGAVGVFGDGWVRVFTGGFAASALVMSSFGAPVIQVSVTSASLAREGRRPA
jgi:hypothetical protein